MSKRLSSVGIILICGVIILCGSLLGVGCAPEGAPEVEPVKIALIAIEQGFAAPYGLNIFTGADMAIEEINAQGGILGGRQVVGRHYDEGYSAEAVLSSVKEAIADGCKIIVGMTDATQCVPAVAYCKELGLPIVITFAGCEPTICVPGYYDAAFNVNMANVPKCFSAYMRWIDAQGYKRLASVLYTSEFGLNNEAVFQEIAPTLNMKRVYVDWYAWGEIGDVRPQLPGAVASDPDFIFLQVYTGVQLYPALERLKELGYDGDVGMCNCGLADGVIAAESPEGLCEGVVSHCRMSATPEVPSTMAWRDKFLAYCKKNNINILKENDMAVGGYAAAWLAALAIDKAGTDDFPADTDKFVKAMYEVDWTHPAGFKVDFTAGGEMKFPHEFIQTIQDGEVVVIDVLEVPPWD